MKTLTTSRRISSRACSLWMNITFALLVGGMLPLLTVTSIAQVQYFREYAPTNTDVLNDGRCIIITAAGDDDLLTVGRYLEPNVPAFGHGIWTNKDGTLNAATLELLSPKESTCYRVIPKSRADSDYLIIQIPIMHSHTICQDSIAFHSADTVLNYDSFS